MVTGDGPSATVRVASWPTPLPFLGWPWLYVALLALSAACLIAGGSVRSWKPEHLRFMAAPVGAILVAFLLSTLMSQVPSLSLVAFLTVLGIAAGAWIIAVLIEDEQINDAIWPTIAVALVLLAVRVILWRRDEGFNVAAYQVLNNAWTGKLQLAWVFNLFAPLLVTRTVSESRRPRAVLYAITWAACGVATYLLFSRMGSAVFAAATVGVWIVNPAHWRKGLVILAIAAAVGAGLVARSDKMSRFVVATILEPNRNPGVAVRLGVWRDALRLFQAHPIAGAGLGTFDEVSYNLEDATAEHLFRGAGWHAHNVYLHVLAETGLLGLLAWLYLWLTIVARLIRDWRHADAGRRLLVTGALCAVCAFLALSMTEVLIGARVHASLRMNLTIALVVILGLAASRTSSDRGGWIQNGRLHSDLPREAPCRSGSWQW